MTKHFEEPARASPMRRALFAAVEHEVDSFLPWDDAGLPPEVAGIAVLSLYELGVVEGGTNPDWSTLRYDLVLTRFPHVSLVHPRAAGSYLDVWVSWAHWLHARGRIDEPTRERLLDEIAAGADRFLGEVGSRFALMAPGLLGDDVDPWVDLDLPRLPS